MTESGDTARLDPQRLDELWDFDDPDGSADRFRVELLSSRPGSGRQAELVTQLARAEMLRGNESRAVDLLAGLGAPADSVVAARLELEFGRVDNSAGRPAAAVPHFMAALGHADRGGDDFLAIDALHMLAIADSDQTERWTRQGLGRVARTTDARARRWAGSLRNNYGWTLSDQGDHLGALRQFEAAVEAYTTAGTAAQVIFARWAMAFALRSLQRLDEALEIQLELLAQDPSDRYVHEELAELHDAQGRPGQAAEHRSRAAELSGS